MKILMRHAIEIRCQIQRVPVQARRVPPLLIGEKDDDVGFASIHWSPAFGIDLKRFSFTAWFPLVVFEGG